MSIKYLIVDDEPIAHEIILRFAKSLDHLEFKKSCFDGLEAISYLSGNRVDLIFLDINMPQLNGLSLLKSLTERPQVIITTAYKEHALDGYAYDVIDYLLKPFSLERFLSAVNRIKTHTDHASKSITPKTDSIFLKSDKKYFQIKLSEIMFVEAQGSYLKVSTRSETILTHGKISDFIFKLPDKFIRVHKSYIINLDHVKSVAGNRIYLPETTIPIGQTYKTSLISTIESQH